MLDKVHEVQLCSLPPRLFHVVQLTNILTPWHVLDRLVVRKIVHNYVKALRENIKLKPLTFLCVVNNVASNIK